jgi:hypothetical protein
MASVFDQYPNLPGFLSEFQDGGLKARTEVNPPSTESILLLGVGLDGPVLEPVAVDPTTVELVFGAGVNPDGTPNGTNLVKGFEQAYLGGCRDIRLMRVTGSPATASLYAAPNTSNVTNVVTDRLGSASGNTSTTFTLNQPIVSSVTLSANGVTLPTSAYTVTNGTSPANATVALNANVTDQEAVVYVTYSYVSGGTTKTVTENGHINVDNSITYWVAGGTSTIYALSEEVDPGSLHLYANGVEVLATGAVTVGNDNQSVILAAGNTHLGDVLEARYTNTVSTVTTPEVDFASIFGGTVYNDGNLQVANLYDNAVTPNVIGKTVTVNKPNAKKNQVTDAPLTYSSVNYPTLAQLVQAVNKDTNNGIYGATVSTEYANVQTSTLVAVPSVPFFGGDDGLNLSNDAMYAVLGGTRDANGNVVQEGAYQLLENYTVDQIVPLGVHADDSLSGMYDNFAYQLALACAVISYRNNAVTGYIPTSSPSEAGLAAVKTQVNNLLNNSPNNFFMRDRAGNILNDSNGNPLDLGGKIEVVAGPDVTFNSVRFGVYSENSAAAYAGFVSQLAPQSAPTNKVLPFANGLRFVYSASQLDSLTGARFVTFKYKNNGTQVAVVDAPMAAQPGSDYTRLSTVRSVQEVVDNVREVCDPYIGEPNEVPQRNSMSAAISKRLDQLQEAGVCVAYDFTVVVTPQMQLMGEAQIELTVVPPLELRRITTIVTLKQSL